MNISRRTLLQSALTAAAVQTASQVTSLFAQNAAVPITRHPKFAIFSKHFIGLPYDRLAEVVSGCGADGIEAPIRPGGHIEPAKAQEELPKLAEALKKHGLEITQVTSALVDTSPQSHAESLLRTAKSLGIERYRLGFFKYDLRRPLWPQLDEIKARLKDLVVMSKDATIEGNLSWPAEVALVKERIGIAYFKNFIWENKRPQPSPLGDGIVGKPYVDMLRKEGYSGPVSLHVEYLRAKPTDSEGLATLVEATKRDMEVLKSWWE